MEDLCHAEQTLIEDLCNAIDIYGGLMPCRIVT